MHSSGSRATGGAQMRAQFGQLCSSSDCIHRGWWFMCCLGAAVFDGKPLAAHISAASRRSRWRSLPLPVGSASRSSGLGHTQCGTAVGQINQFETNLAQIRVELRGPPTPPCTARCVSHLQTVTFRFVLEDPPLGATDSAGVQTAISPPACRVNVWFSTV